MTSLFERLDKVEKLNHWWDNLELYKKFMVYNKCHKKKI